MKKIALALLLFSGGVISANVVSDCKPPCKEEYDLCRSMIPLFLEENELDRHEEKCEGDKKGCLVGCVVRELSEEEIARVLECAKEKEKSEATAY